MPTDERTEDYLEMDMSEEPEIIKSITAPNPLGFGFMTYLMGLQRGLKDED